MDTNDFISKLNKIQELLSKEEYEFALDIAQELITIEKEGDFPYNLTHRLYQLNSNAISLNNQSKILPSLQILKKSLKTIEIVEFHQYLKEKEGVSIDIEILRKELELLILRGKIKAIISNNVVSFEN